MDPTPRADSTPSPRYDLVEICEDSRGRIWMGTNGGEVLCFDPSSNKNEVPNAATKPSGSWSVYNESDGIDVGRQPKILALRDGTIWVVYGSDSEHINIFDQTRWRTTRLEEPGLPGSSCGQPIQTRDGAVWVSGRYVVSRYYQGQWKSYSKSDYLYSECFQSSAPSSDGALWICGPDTDITRIDYQTPRWQTLEDLNFYWESPQGNRWFLHRDGRIVVNRGGTWTSYGVEDGVIDGPVVLLGTEGGDLWVAGSHQHVAATARFAKGTSGPGSFTTSSLGGSTGVV